MMTLTYFRQYMPDMTDTDNHALAQRGIGFLCDENGLDWYESQALFSDNTVKVQYNLEGIVNNLSRDISMLYPENMSIVELDPSAIPDDLTPNGLWHWDGKQFIDLSQTDTVQQQTAQQKKTALLALAAQKIAPLEDAEILGDITEDEATQLLAWRRFRLQVNRIDITLAPNIDWPVRPDEQ